MRADQLPRPLLDDIFAHRSLPIIGAGFSRNAELPRGETMPDWEELAKQLLKDIPNYPFSTPIEAISAYEHTYTRTKLVERVHRLLHVGTASPGNVHKAFCELPFDIVCTTNYDRLLEKGYELRGSPYWTLVDETQLSIDWDTKMTRILKLHGDILQPRTMTLTEEDYDGFVSRKPMFATFLGNLLITRTAIFIGYSMDDPDFRQIWQVVKDRLGELRRPAYALIPDKHPAIIARWGRRGVNAIAI